MLGCGLDAEFVRSDGEEVIVLKGKKLKRVMPNSVQRLVLVRCPVHGNKYARGRSAITLASGLSLTDPSRAARESMGIGAAARRRQVAAGEEPADRTADEDAVSPTLMSPAVGWDHSGTTAPAARPDYDCK